MKLRASTLIAAICAVFISAMVGAGVASASEPKIVRIDKGGNGPLSHTLSLGLNKAAIVELPTDARDVLVSNPEIANAVIRTPRRIYVLGLTVGTTNAFFFSRTGEQILNLEVRIDRDLTALNDAIKKFVPDARVKLESINDNVVLAGTVPNLSKASQIREIAARYVGSEDQVLNMLTIEGGEQVLLKVTIAEMQRSLLKQLGVDLTQAAFDIGQTAVRLQTENPFSLLGQALSGAENTFSYDGSDLDVDGVVRLLERNGLLRTLAEPNLTAISGESATFLAGGEFPVPSSRDRNGNVSIEFKPFGVGLGFTPVVLSEGRISLKISTEVSELTSDGAFVSQGTSFIDPDSGDLVTLNGVTIPALRVRRAETAVELPSGGSLVIAGLLQESTRQNIDGTPGLKDVPILGTLFRSRDFQNSETELALIVTPYIVDPAARDDLALPTDGFVPASDADTLLMGRLNATYGVEGEGSVKGALKGPAGFIME